MKTNMWLGFPCGSASKESAYNTRDLGSIPGLGRSSGEGPVFWPGEFHKLYSPWGHKESDVTDYSQQKQDQELPVAHIMNS